MLPGDTGHFRGGPCADVVENRVKKEEPVFATPAIHMKKILSMKNRIWRGEPCNQCKVMKKIIITMV